MAEAQRERGPLSEWLELMMAEISRRQEEAQAGLDEQAARTSAPIPSPSPSAERAEHHTAAIASRDVSRRAKLA
ncbi:MAG TPA: hypothetical protein VKT19_00860 [Steroidobacteraceae bacterium]|nr:hypothetical protein [Steroidobacteraceae bacterium]